ncbi:g2677 [Coccomyxa elongata]
MASTSAELRAAASVRAAAFSEQGNDRSDFAMQSYRRMKADSEWDVLESKLAGREPGYQDITVTCLIACLDDAMGNSLASAVRDDMDLSCKIPAGLASSRPQLVVATLDINQGYNLPGEQLIGWKPEGALAKTQRGYLSNICTHKAVRRTGVANRLIRVAIEEGSRAGIRWLYVHAAEQNTAAIQLYTQRCGFQLEQEEGPGIAIRLNRPRRLLFRQCLG